MTAPHIRRVTSPEVTEPPARVFSQCLVTGNLVYIAGQHAGDPSGAVKGDRSMAGQTRTTLAKIRALVTAAGGSMGDIVKVSIFTTDISHRATITETRREFFAGDFPCSTMVEVKGLVHPDLSIEIEAVAVLGARRARR
jgi:2-iminobutanoate/2-iminopropanoate deaminase